MTERREPFLTLERDEERGLGFVTLDRPDKLNAWNYESLRQLVAICEQLRRDDTVRCVVLRANGRAFCAGADLGMPEDRVTGGSGSHRTRNYYETFRRVHERFHVVSNLPQPVVVAVHGYCLGAGVEVAMLGDIRIASDDATFALPEAHVGVALDGGADLRLVTEIGPAWTKLLAFTGRRIDATTAARIGIVQEVVAGDRLAEHVTELATEIAANAPLAVQGIKRTVNYRAEQGLWEALRFEASSSAAVFCSEDAPEGFRAAAEKRPPRFRGR